jgi:murein DD-endopeptidase MepM/ murein hydrolase activator NlpD
LKEIRKNGDKHIKAVSRFIKAQRLSGNENAVFMAVIFVGALCLYILWSAVQKLAAALKKFGVFSKKTFGVHNGSVISAAKRAKTAAAFRVFIVKDKIRGSISLFLRRKEHFGLRKAVGFALSDFAGFIKSHGIKKRHIINYGAPVLAVAALCIAINQVFAADYAVSVISGGRQIGLISAEQVLSDASRRLNSKLSYSDTENSSGEIFVTSQLAITPVTGVNVMDENALAVALEANGEMIAPEVTADPALPPAAPVVFSETPLGETPDLTTAPIGEPAPAETSEPAEFVVDDGRVLAYGVYIDGEFVGAIDEPDKITSYLSERQKPYTYDPTVTKIEFDRKIDYQYENYFYPSDIINEQQIIDKLSGTQMAAVHYTVELGDSPWAVAEKNNLSIDELKARPATFEGRRIPDITKEFPVGMRIELTAQVPYLSVMVTKNSIYTTEMSYEIEQTFDSNMFKGDRKIVSEGSLGMEEVHATIVYRNGNEQVQRTIVSRKTVIAPVTQYEIVGTKEPKTVVKSYGGGSGDYFWPVEGGYISAYQGDNRGHKGIDIAAPYGTNIYAAESGTIQRIGNKGDGYGICIFIKHDDGTVTVYGHMSRSADFAVGDRVVKGQLIGFVGSTGNSTGNHLHFEVRTSNGYSNPLNYVKQG